MAFLGCSQHFLGFLQQRGISGPTFLITAYFPRFRTWSLQHQDMQEFIPRTLIHRQLLLTEETKHRFFSSLPKFSVSEVPFPYCFPPSLGTTLKIDLVFLLCLGSTARIWILAFLTLLHAWALLEECHNSQHISDQESHRKCWKAEEFFWMIFVRTENTLPTPKWRCCSRGQGGVVGWFDPDGSLLTQHILILGTDHIHSSADNIKSWQDGPFPLSLPLIFLPQRFSTSAHPSLCLRSLTWFRYSRKVSLVHICAGKLQFQRRQMHPQLQPRQNRRNSSFWQSRSLAGSWIGSFSCLYLPFPHLIRQGDRCPLLTNWAELLIPSKKQEIHF